MSAPHLYSVRQLPSGGASHCNDCHVRHTCVPSCMPPSELVQLVGRRIRISRQRPLYRPGEQVGNRFYAVHHGTFKSVRGTSGAQEKITAFHMSGDFLALEDIDLERHSASAVALEDGEVCEIYCRASPATLAPFHRLLSKQLVREQNMAQLLRKSSAEKKLASFLLELSWRFATRGYSARRFRLAMSRQEIASYLALSPECVSRYLFQFKRSGLLELNEREVTLLDPAALQQLARSDCTPSQPALAS